MDKLKPRVLIVDDEKFYLDVLLELLNHDYKPLVAKDGEQALRLALSDPQPELILLDILMPGIDGYEVCRQLKANPATRDIPIIFLTIKGEVTDELKGFELGAADYITKPMSPPIVHARVHTHLYLSQIRRQLTDQNHFLEQKVEERTRELSHTKDAAIFCMASLAETRHSETGRHILRTQRYIKALAIQLKSHPRFSHFLDDNTIELIYKVSPLHDIGKVGVPDVILLKPGKLNPQEWEEMKKHAQHGYDALQRAEQELGTTEYLQIAKEIAYTHHEQWDGNGYPRGIKGDEIPISGRLMALADVYDALINKRIYKNAFGHEESVEIIRHGSGTQFDPDVVEAFLAIQNEFKRIATEFVDLQPNSTK